MFLSCPYAASVSQKQERQRWFQIAITSALPDVRIRYDLLLAVLIRRQVNWPLSLSIHPPFLQFPSICCGKTTHAYHPPRLRTMTRALSLTLPNGLAIHDPRSFQGRPLSFAGFISVSPPRRKTFIFKSRFKVGSDVLGLTSFLFSFFFFL